MSDIELAMILSSLELSNCSPRPSRIHGFITQKTAGENNYRKTRYGNQEDLLTYLLYLHYGLQIFLIAAASPTRLKIKLVTSRT